jgi:hypothetical protein
LWYFHVNVYYNPNWFISSIFLHSTLVPFFFFFSTGVWTQCLRLAKQAFHHLSHSTSCITQSLSYGSSSQVFLFCLFVCEWYWFELKAFTLVQSTSLIMVKGFSR